MCDVCLKHGGNGKWYLNAKNYLKETMEENGAPEYLEQFWGNLENSNLNKAKGIMNMSWVSKNVRTPILGRFLKWYANRGFVKDKGKRDPVAAQGHYGMVIPLEEAKVIVSEKASVVTRALCPCKWFNRGVKSDTCLGFSALADALPKLPRFIPDKGVQILDGDKAKAALEEFNAKGLVHTVWCGPLPAIAAVCSCDLPVCGGLRLRRDFDIKACCKGEYVAVLDAVKCTGCGKCISRCQFGALTFSPISGTARVDPLKCFGCGNCTLTCEANALKLVDRHEVPQVRGMY